MPLIGHPGGQRSGRCRGSAILEGADAGLACGRVQGGCVSSLRSGGCSGSALREGADAGLACGRVQGGGVSSLRSGGCSGSAILEGADAGLACGAGRSVSRGGSADTQEDAWRLAVEWRK